MPNDFHRTNLNLFRADVDWLTKTYGYGWTEKARDIIHGYVNGAAENTHSIFRDHSCWLCQDGAKPCAYGNPARCEYPHAYND